MAITTSHCVYHTQAPHTPYTERLVRNKYKHITIDSEYYSYKYLLGI